MKAWAFSAGGIDASSRLMTGSGPIRGGYPVSLTCILVERGEGLVLVDTGWGSPTVDSPEGPRVLVHAGDTFVHARELEGEEDLPLGVRLYRRILHEDKAGVATSLARFRALRRERPDVALVNAHDASLLARLPAFPAYL